MTTARAATVGRAFSAERYLLQARRWADKAAKRRHWTHRGPLLALAWGYLKLAADAVKRMPERG